MPSIQDMLVGLEPAAAVDVLLRLLGNAAAGADVTSAVPDLLQAIFSRTAGNVQVRKLAYEICKYASLSDSDVGKLLDAAKSDASSSNPEVVACALKFLPALPGSHLASLLHTGEVLELYVPRLSADAAVVRAAAVQGLAAILLTPEVQEAAASSPGLANAYEEFWDQEADALLDEKPFVVALSAAAVDRMLRAGAAASDCKTGAEFMMDKVAARAAQRLAAALSPILEMCSMVPDPGQVAVFQMLLALVQRLQHQAAAALASGAPPPRPGIPLPSLPSAISSSAIYLSSYIRCLDIGTRLEACTVLLALAALPLLDGTAASTTGPVPQGMVLEAVQALLELREREFMEAGLVAMCDAICCVLPALTASARAQVLRQLWPLASRINDVPQRIRIYGTAWGEAVNAEMACRTAGNAGQVLAAGRTAPAAPAADPMAQLASGLDQGPGQIPAEAGLVVTVPEPISVWAQLADGFIATLMSGKPPVSADSVAMSQAAPFAGPTGGSTTSATAPLSLPSGGSLERNDSRNSAAAAAATQSSKDRAADSSPPPLMHSASKIERPEKEKKGALFGATKLFASKRVKDEKKAAEAAAAASTSALEEERVRSEIEQEAAAAAQSGAMKAAQVQAAQVQAAAVHAAAVQAAQADKASAVATATADASALAVARSIPYQTLRHELLAALLQQLASHSAAAAAHEVSLEAESAARHDRPALALTPGYTGQQQQRRLAETVQWVAACADALAETSQCVAWEPYVLPTISSQTSIAAQGKASADFSSYVADQWLALAQSVMQAAGAARVQLRRLVADAEAAAEAAAAAGEDAAGGGAGSYSYTAAGGFGGMGAMGYYGATPGAGDPALEARQRAAQAAFHKGLLVLLDRKVLALQAPLHKLLLAWSSLSRAVRPRLAWVAARCCELPGHWDEHWDALLRAMDELLLRGTAVTANSRAMDFIGSALAGSLLKAGRQAWAQPDKPFLFDVAAASALCEAPEYECLGLVAVLSALQHLIARLNNHIAEAVPLGAAGKAHGEAATVAKRLDMLLRQFIATEAAALPHIKDWTRRLLRSLATILTYSPPVNLPPTVAALGFVAKQAHEHGDGDDAAAAPADGMGAHQGAGEGSDSDSSSVYHPPQDAPAPVETQASFGGAPLPAVNGMPSGTPTAGGLESRQRAGSLAPGGPVGTSYMVHSSVTSSLWGYPFGALTSPVLHVSKRSKRYAALANHVAAVAPSRPAPPPPASATAARGPEAGPALSSHTLCRLDSEAFWGSLTPEQSAWHEMTGPADPLLLRACYVTDGTHGPGGSITVKLVATNRLQVDLSDVEVKMRRSGPLLFEMRFVSWVIPKLTPHDSASTEFQVRLLGYGEAAMLLQLQLTPGPPRVDVAPLIITCLPMFIPVTASLRWPAATQPAPNAGDFFKAWGSLPARVELGGVCTWPGLEGAQALLSSLLRQPLACCWLQYVAAAGSYQAGFTGTTCHGDTLSLIVITQLMPAPAPGAAPESMCSVSVRSTSAELIISLQGSPATWLMQITGGAAALGGQRSSHAPGMRPPVHPRVAGLQQCYNATAQSAELAMSMSGIGLTSVGSVGGASAAAAANGDVASSAWAKSAALVEWQRLSSLD